MSTKLNKKILVLGDLFADLDLRLTLMQGFRGYYIQDEEVIIERIKKIEEGIYRFDFNDGLSRIREFLQIVQDLFVNAKILTQKADMSQLMGSDKTWKKRTN